MAGSNSCVFCDIIAGRAPAGVVYRDELVCAFMDIRPVNPGHVLVIPLRHAPFLADLEPGTGGRMFEVGQRLAQALRVSGVRCEGINLFLADGEPAGQEVFHAHLHVVPRFIGDGFQLRYGPDYGKPFERTAMEAIAESIRNSIDPDGAKGEPDFDGAERAGVDRSTPSAPVLAPMTDADFVAFAAEAIPGYAADKVTSGQWAKEESLALSQQTFSELLPAGRSTPDNYLFNILDEQAHTVGRLWIAVREQAGRRIAYIFDVRIRPEYRRRRHATRALEAAEDEARRLGLSGIGLHVFGHNRNARTLYEKLGYRATNIGMFKAL